MKNLGTKTLETDRLILRKFTSSDARGMFHGWASDEKTTRYLSWSPHRNIEETQSLINNWIMRYDDNCYNWVIELKSSHELIGNISAISVNIRHHNCEIGYCYGSKYWNQGYATEALKAVIHFMLYDCEMHLVEARHQSLNPASGKVMEKAGMTKDAVLRGRRYNAETNSYCDLVFYSATRYASKQDPKP